MPSRRPWYEWVIAAYAALGIASGITGLLDPPTMLAAAMGGTLHAIYSATLAAASLLALSAWWRRRHAAENAAMAAVTALVFVPVVLASLVSGSTAATWERIGMVIAVAVALLGMRADRGLTRREIDHIEQAMTRGGR